MQNDGCLRSSHLIEDLSREISYKGSDGHDLCYLPHGPPLRRAIRLLPAGLSSGGDERNRHESAGHSKKNGSKRWGILGEK